MVHFFFTSAANVGTVISHRTMIDKSDYNVLLQFSRLSYLELGTYANGSYIINYIQNGL